MAWIGLPWTWKRPPRDAVKEQLRAIAKQGGSESAMNHVVSYALIIAFSIGSLITLAGDALNALLAHAASRQVDIPNLVSLIVSFLVVIGMDLAMLWAARVITQRNERRNGEGVLRHQVMLVFCAATESLTYFYMSIKFDHPTPLTLSSLGAAVSAGMVWFILALRAFGAPVVAIYLNMGRPLPVGAEDMLLEMARATGEGAINQMVRIGRDPDAPLERIMALWRAADLVSPKLDARIQALLNAERQTREMASVTGMTSAGSAAGNASALLGISASPTQTLPPRPITALPSARPLRHPGDESEELALTKPGIPAIKVSNGAYDFSDLANWDDPDDDDDPDPDDDRPAARRGDVTRGEKRSHERGNYQPARNSTNGRHAENLREDGKRRAKAKSAASLRKETMESLRQERIASILDEMLAENPNLNAFRFLNRLADEHLGGMRHARASRMVDRRREEMYPQFASSWRGLNLYHAPDTIPLYEDEGDETDTPDSVTASYSAVASR